MSDVIVSKKEAAHSGDPLAGAIHVDCDLGKGLMKRSHCSDPWKRSILLVLLVLRFESPFWYQLPVDRKQVCSRVCWVSGV